MPESLPWSARVELIPQTWTSSFDLVGASETGNRIPMRPALMNRQGYGVKTVNGSLADGFGLKTSCRSEKLVRRQIGRPLRIHLRQLCCKQLPFLVQHIKGDPRADGKFLLCPLQR